MNEEKKKKAVKNAMDSMLPRDWTTGLLDRALLDLVKAREALSKKDFEATNNNIIHAENILLELEASIQTQDEASVQTAKFLHTLANDLVLVNVNKDMSGLEEAAQLLHRLRNTYLANRQKL